MLYHRFFKSQIAVSLLILILSKVKQNCTKNSIFENIERQNGLRYIVFEFWLSLVQIKLTENSVQDYSKAKMLKFYASKPKIKKKTILGF